MFSNYGNGQLRFWTLLAIFSGFFHFIPIFAQSPIQKPIKLVFDDRILTLNFQTHPEFLKKSTKNYLPIGNLKIPVDLSTTLPKTSELSLLETEFSTEIISEKLKNYFKDASIVNRENATPVEIIKHASGGIEIKGRPIDGYFEVDMPVLEKLINKAIQEKQTTHVRVPSKKVYAKVKADKSLFSRGIREVIAIGRSNFEGSSESRTQNILAGAKKFNGLIVPKGKPFSFNRILASVEETDGFVPELVIKGNETEKELGGGLCQVSTTLFRAAFSGGLPILARRGHSYAVQYYKPYGLDATIYLGGQDFQFQNDTPGDILIQTFVDNSDLFFVFYGASDGRKVALDGPFITNYQEAPESEIFETNELAAGEMQEVSPAHDGFTAKWIRRVSQKGQKLKEENLVSIYRPWAAKILKGTKPIEVALAPAVPEEKIIEDIDKKELAKNKKQTRVFSERKYGQSSR